MTIVPFERIASARVRRFDAYWRSKMVDSLIPARSAIDPGEILPLLPYFIIVEIEKSPFRVRYRLCGTMVQQYDQEVTGKYIEELKASDAEKAELIGAYRLTVESTNPQFCINEYKARTADVDLLVEGGIWPLRGPSGAIEQCAVIQDYIQL